MTIRHHQTIDQTFAERQRITRLLDRVQGEQISDAELEEIGASLKKAGSRALDPLVRRIWRERRSEQLARYTFLLDFFEDETWLEELVQMALTRQDLEQEGRRTLLQALEGYGIDTATLPLAGLPPLGAAHPSEILPILFGMGERGMVRGVGDILALEPEARPDVVAELAQVADPRVAEFLAILADVDDPDIADAAIGALGRVREPAAAAALTLLCERHPDEEMRKRAAVSLRRLMFLGIPSPPPSPGASPMSGTAHAGTFDGNGNLTVCLPFRQADGLLTVLYLHLHEVRGLCTAIGYRDLTDEFFHDQLENLRQEEGLQAIRPELALALLRDGIQRSRDQELFLPPEYYVFRSLLDGHDQPAAHYEPAFPDADLLRLAASTRHRALGATLLDDEFFVDWILSGRRVYFYAERWGELEARGDHAGMARLVEDFCASLLMPRRERLVRRLLLSAEFMREARRDRRLVETVLATAASLRYQGALAVTHPFLKRLAFESIACARENLAEGYDPRTQPEMDDYWDDEDA